MKHIHTFLVSTEHQGLTVEEYIRDVLHYSGRAIQRLTRTKSIRMNGKSVYLQKKLAAHDQITIAEPAEDTYGVEPQQGAIEILYEDTDVIVINKPPNMLVHPTGQTEQGTLANYLAHYFQTRQTIHRIRPLHRLDRDTSGCILFAKDAKTQARLEQQMHNGELKRTYTAIVDGCPTAKKGMIDARIGQHPAFPNRRAVVPEGEPAITRYEWLETAKDAALLRISLETGRTHQIRVHMAYIGHPVTGDRMYGKRSAYISRQALHAACLRWIGHDDQPLEVRAPLPLDMKRLWERKKAASDPSSDSAF
ncbi:RluA family pseudouridine synthase [Fodinisporobacter ferrooxydans]|uniref:Pseudouridine synthase n=1 Tax=Fodinisporobacter ferrooxydans TaxID=2901836 RepID=A0ABY4CJ37_9BACL|nr:RluA family pseudouridine synthase [Alicyclobacillaceae bacterium MYW30-H2]